MLIKELSVLIDERNIKGFLHKDEGEALYAAAKTVGDLGPCLEIGSYCGKSTLYLALACRETNNRVFAVDHHRGSEEHQLGEEYHDAELYDQATQRMNSFPAFQNTIDTFNFTQDVIPVVAKSENLVKHWSTPLGMVFVDGGHSLESAMHDCLQWSTKIMTGGILAIHDIYENESMGGQAPKQAMQALIQKSNFQVIEQVRSLCLLKYI